VLINLSILEARVALQVLELGVSHIGFMKAPRSNQTMQGNKCELKVFLKFSIPYIFP
jgi:hypothetical protein